MSTVQSGFADLNGATFYYEVAGAGEPLVLVHAGICDARMWDEQFGLFAQSYRVVRYDQRGFGRTPAVEKQLVLVLDGRAEQVGRSKERTDAFFWLRRISRRISNMSYDARRRWML